MTAEDAQQVHSCGELSVGDRIEAWHNGRLFHRGGVIRTVPATDLFWILDERTGTRRLIDAGALVVLRLPEPAESSAADHPADVPPAAREAASCVPLFQAPSLAC